MLNTVRTTDFVACLLVLAPLLLSVLLWYYWYVLIPYGKFPSLRCEHRLPFWILTRKNSNSIMFQMLVDISKKYQAEGVFAAWIGLPYLFVYGEEIVKTILSEPAAVDKPKMYQLLEFAIGKTLLTSNGEMSRRQRKLVSRAFNVVSLKEHTSVINKQAKALVEQLSEMKSQPTTQTINLLKESSLRIIYESSLGVKGRNNSEEDRRIMEITEELCEFVIYRMWSPWLYFDFILPLFPYARKALRLVKEGKNISEQLLEDIKESVSARLMSSTSPEADSECFGRKAKSFGEILVEQHLKDPSFSMTELRDITNNLIIAAFDTASQALMWSIYFLGLHQDVQERVYHEVMSETEGDVQYNDLHKLTFLECVIKESQRLYPVPIFARRLGKDIQCGKYLIPQNATVAIFSYRLHRNPDIYPDPEKFDPERFIAKDSKIKPWNYIPFAEGNRPCVGRNFAMMKMKIILVHILRNFKIISLDRREDVKLTWAIVIGSTKKLRMQFVPRQLLHPTDS